MGKSMALVSSYDEEQQQEDEDEDEGYFADFSSEHDDDDDGSENPAAATTPFISPPVVPNKSRTTTTTTHPQFSVVAVVAAALRRSLITCSVEDAADDVDIGWPTDVRHVSHVTFDRFNGFLGLPLELQPDVPRKPPSASARVFGVSAQSMQCSYDHRGNSVPTILLRMQSRLYSEGGLQAEGIFRINAENSQEESVRNQLNRGVVPHGIDVHCLSGLIKAWFRELPTGVLDSLTAEQVMNCNTEQECTQLVKLLPPTEAALLDWAINLMTDVVCHQNHNKMNARNIAMVFAPNMTQMADPLTALIHAVQVMNLLKSLIMKTLRERDQESVATKLFTENIPQDTTPSNTTTEMIVHEQVFDDCSCEELASDKLLTSSGAISETVEVECNNNDKLMSDAGEKYESSRKRRTLGHSFKEEYENMEAEGILNRLSLRKGIQKLCQHPVFQLSKVVKKSG